MSSQPLADLTELAAERLRHALESHAGRSSHLAYAGPGKQMTQTVIALRAGEELAEHQNPGQATVQVLIGRVRITARAEDHTAKDSAEGGAGALLVVPAGPHSLHALADSAVLLTVART